MSVSRLHLWLITCLDLIVRVSTQHDIRSGHSERNLATVTCKEICGVPRRKERVPSWQDTRTRSDLYDLPCQVARAMRGGELTWAGHGWCRWHSHRRSRESSAPGTHCQRYRVGAANPPRPPHSQSSARARTCWRSLPPPPGNSLTTKHTPLCKWIYGHCKSLRYGVHGSYSSHDRGGEKLWRSC